MLVRREAGGTVEADHERTGRLIETVRETGERGLRVWRPPSHVSFGRRDANAETFDRARAAAEQRGYPSTVRAAGGRAVAFTEGTLSVVLASPTDADHLGIDSRYDDGLDWLERAFRACGVDAEPGEPPNSFCPGSHSLQVEGRKVAGLAQRVRRDIAVLGAIVIVRDGAAVADVLEPVYETLGVPFERDSVGYLDGADGGPDCSVVGDAIVETVD